MIGRNLIYLLAVQEQWEIHGLDLASRLSPLKQMLRSGPLVLLSSDQHLVSLKVV